SSIHRCTHCYLTTRSIVFNSIVKQHQQRLLQQHRVPDHERIVAILQVHADTLLLGECPNALYSCMSNLVETHHLVLSVLSSSVQPSECQHSIRHRCHMIRFGNDILQQRRVLCLHLLTAAQEHLSIRTHQRQRSSEFVRGISNELLLTCKCQSCRYQCT